MIRRALVFLAAFAVAAILAGPCLAGDAETVQADVRKLVDAVYGYDVETTIRYTYPEVVAVIGGEEQMRTLLTSAFEQVKTMGIEVESFRFPAEPTFVEGEKRDYAIVPTETVMAAQGQRIRSRNFQFGIRPRGESGWTYVEGSRVDEGMLSTLFQDFPADYTFPEVSRTPL